MTWLNVLQKRSGMVFLLHFVFKPKKEVCHISELDHKNLFDLILLLFFIRLFPNNVVFFKMPPKNDLEGRHVKMWKKMATVWLFHLFNPN